MLARIDIIQGDLTRQEVDAIVNAANAKMLGGGGVDGAIHRAAGPELLEACRQVPEVRPGVRCPTGEARLTPGFRLRARYVIHTVGPVYRALPEDADLLRAAFRASLTLAAHHEIRTLAFPAISCGVYGYPPEEAAARSREVLEERSWNLDEIRFVLFSADVFEAWERAYR